jgi:hypothetical protein
MKVATSFSTGDDPQRGAVEAYGRVVAELGAPPQLLLVHASVRADARAILASLAVSAPGVAIHGATSCVGVMTQEGFHRSDAGAVGLLGVLDPEGAYGVGAAELDGDPRAAATVAVTLALRDAGRDGEIPDMIWITQAPGNEELVLQGICDLVGPEVPIGGGSSSDDLGGGGWLQFATGAMFKNAVVVAVLFTSHGVSFGFQSGYDPTHLKATVTKGDRRTISELGGRPAAAVYDEWSGGAISQFLRDGGSVLMNTTLSPLGRVVGKTADIPYFLLSHPDQVRPDGSMAVFSNIAVGDEVFLMRGSPESLVRRAGRVARSVLQPSSGDRRIAGAVVVYCAGCMLTVQDRMPEVVASIRAGLGDGVPFLGVFTLGEQGCFLGGENRHGNLMISVLAFLT